MADENAAANDVEMTHKTGVVVHRRCLNCHDDFEAPQTGAEVNRRFCKSMCVVLYEAEHGAGEAAKAAKALRAKERTVTAEEATKSLGSKEQVQRKLLDLVSVISLQAVWGGEVRDAPLRIGCSAQPTPARRRPASLV